MPPKFLISPEPPQARVVSVPEWETLAIAQIHERIHAISHDIIRLRDAGELEQARTLVPQLLALSGEILKRAEALHLAVATAHDLGTIEKAPFFDTGNVRG